MFLRVAGLLFCVAATALAYSQDQKTEVKHGPAPVASARSGKEMFSVYCASCHGTDAKGNGPAAPALKDPPSDLTVLSKKNGGKFPTDHVYSILRGQATVTAHGNHDMPVWGRIFWNMSKGHESEVELRIANLTHYIESLQVK